jgi:hypothetical protein
MLFYSDQEPEEIIVLIRTGTYLFLLIVLILLTKLKTNSEMNSITWNLNQDKSFQHLFTLKIIGKQGWSFPLFIKMLKMKASGYEDRKQRWIETRTHDGARTKFSNEFIKSGNLDINYGKLFSKLFDYRQKGDYGDLFDFDEELVLPLVDQVRDFILAIEKLIGKWFLLVFYQVNCLYLGTKDIVTMKNTTSPAS